MSKEFDFSISHGQVRCDFPPTSNTSEDVRNLLLLAILEELRAMKVDARLREHDAKLESLMQLLGKHPKQL